MKNRTLGLVSLYASVAFGHNMPMLPFDITNRPRTFIPADVDLKKQRLLKKANSAWKRKDVDAFCKYSEKYRKA